MRRVATILVAAFFGVLLGSTVPAQAATGDLTCPTTFEYDFSPALTAGGSSSVTGTASFFSCTSPNGQHTALHTASATGTGSASGATGTNPCTLVFTITGTATITWNDNSSTVVSFTINTNLSNGTLAVQSSVTSGTFNGDTVTVTVVNATPNTDCATDGLKQVTGTSTVSFN